MKEVLCLADVQKYCDIHGISYEYVKYKLKYYKKKKEGSLPISIQLQLAINAYQKRKRYQDLLYKGTTLIRYCKDNNIIYRRIAYRCAYFIKCGNNFDDLNEFQIDKFIDDYYLKEEVNDLKNIFTTLDNNDQVEYRKICRILNINYKKIQKLKYKNNLSLRELIYMCWYSYDKYDDEGIYISQKKLTQVIKGKELKINDLYGIYRSGNKDYLSVILEYEKPYLIGFIMRTIREYNFKIFPSEYNDLFAEANIILTNCIKRNVFNHVGRIIRYIEKSVTRQILKYLIKNYANKFNFTDNTITYKESWEY